MTLRYNTPSVARMVHLLGCTRDEAKQIKAVMDGPATVENKSRMERIDAILPRSFGVEFIKGRDSERSPSFFYCNRGDTYDCTVVKIGDRFRLSSWGDIVERGSYE